jgi:hypothetical protein
MCRQTGNFIRELSLLCVERDGEKFFSRPVLF